jgi:hypothetical protein
VGLTKLTPSYSGCLKIWETQPPGTLGVCPGLYGDCFIFTFTSIYVTGTTVDKLERVLQEAAVS